MAIVEVFTTKRHTKIKETYAVGRGKPLPIGASITPDGINFSVFAEHATAVTLVLLSPKEHTPFYEIPLDPKYNKTGHVWHIHVLELSPQIHYGYRVDGPYAPQEGHRYDKRTMLIDPYAKALSGGKVWGQPSVDSRRGSNPWGRYSCIVDQQFDWEGDCPLVVPMQDSIIYEMHVRGFTRHASSQADCPGTFRGIIEKIPYLKSLGITAVELMPICEFNENENTHRNPFTGENLKNCWGYSTIGFFAPKASYAYNNQKDGHILEFKELVRALHKNDIEVILDVVFNHTAEGSENGPTLHFRGLDNSVYYILGTHGEYLNFSGCGNTVHCNHPLIRDFILDCLHYWVTEMHVDGFRFDLAAILGRDQNGGVLENPPVIERIARDPVLGDTKLIAEAWDAAGLYQVGNFPSCGRWAEWNGKYRDDVRAFIRGDNGKVHALAMRILGSPDLYKKSGRYPYHSINFITSHDGFTLYDLVSYNDKHNEMNGENNSDGAPENFSWNCGAEGPTQNPHILGLRRRQMKNLLTILFLSQGVPMILAGDEMARTQKGNNNAYCQDNEISWIDWMQAKENQDILRFTQEIIAFRRRHRSLRRQDFIEASTSDYAGIQWHGIKVYEPDWGHYSHTIAFLLAGCAVPKGDNDIYVAINAYWEPLKFEIPIPPCGLPWHILVDTSRVSPDDIIPETAVPKRRLDANQYRVAARSVLVLVAC